MSMSHETKTLDKPDETRSFARGRMDLVRIGGGVVGRLTCQPGWRWSEHVKPIAGTPLCEASHFLYQVTGRMHVKMADGQEFETGPGEVAVIEPGHDAWVVGEEPVTLVDWGGAAHYAKR
jgi:hypothetical protein